MPTLPSYLPIFFGQAFASPPGSQVEIDSPYGEIDVDALRWAQSADVLYLFHPNHPPYKLARNSDTDWALTKVAFQDGPWGEINPDTDLLQTNLLKNGSFDGGYTNWTQTTTGFGFVNFDGTSNSVLFQSYDSA